MKNFSFRLGRRLLLLGITASLPALSPGSALAAPAVVRLSPTAVPTVNSFSPTSGVTGSSVNISGTGFSTATTVTFNNVGASFTINSSTSITATVPASASSGRIRVTNTDGTGVSSSNFTVTLPPSISSVTPSAAKVGVNVNVNGSRLGSASQVTLNGTPVAFTQVSTSRVSFVVPAGATSGFVTVTTPDGTATSPSAFTVLPDKPTITSFTPTSGAPGVTSVSITGTDFTGATEVRFGTTSAGAYTVNSNTSITATVPLGATSGRIRVITPGGTGVSSTSFTVAGAPTITSFTPTTAAVGSSVLIRGTNFVNVTSVLFNGTAATFTTLSRTRVRATVPAGATSGDITLTTPSGTATSPTPFTLNPNAPTISSFTPTSGSPPPTPASGTNVTINGANFLGNAGTSVSNTQVFFNGVQATTVTFVSATQIRARVPAGATTGPITVTTANGSGLSASNFTVTGNTAPTITGTTTQRGCASSQLAISYTVGDAQTPANDLTVTGSSPEDGTVITFIADNTGTGANRMALVDAVDLVNGGTASLTLTVTDGGGLTNQITFNITLDAVVTADAGSDQNVTANQPVALSGAVTGPATVQWSTSGTGTFDNAAAAATNYNPSQADYLNNSVVLTLTALQPAGSTCPNASDATLISFSRPDRIVTGAETVSGVYANILVVAGAVMTAENVDVSTSLDVQSGAVLTFGASCNPVTGTGSFTLEDGATLNICSLQGITMGGGVGQIRLSGGRSFSPAATYAYVGSGAQNSGSGLPLNLTGSVIVNNGGGGVDLTNNLNLRGELHLVNGNLRPTEVMFRVMSDATATGVVDNQNGIVDGIATVQRYLAPTTTGALGYHHLSSPVQAAPVSDLNVSGFTAVTNPAFNSTANTNSVRPYPNVFAYNEQRFPANAGFSLGYYSPASTSDLLEPGRGYSVYITSSLTPDFVGTLTTGPVPRNGLTKTGNFNAAQGKSGWHLLGNPYPSPIDWDLLTVPAGMNNTAYVWHSTGGNNGFYEALVNGSGPGGADLIGLGQGFFVRVTSAPTVNFSFTDAARVTSATPNVPVYRSSAVEPQLALSLRATNATAAEAATAVVRFTEGATAGYDADLDGARPGRNVGVPTLAMPIAGEELDVNALAPADLTAGARLPLLVDVPAAGTYELAMQNLTGFAGTDVYLTDGLTGTSQRLTASSRYTFTANAAGEQPTRFTLRFGDAPATTTAGLTVAPNPASARAQVHLPAAVGTVTLVDALGRTVRTQALAAGQTDATLNLAGLPAGVYTVRAGAATTRLVVE